MKGDGSKRHGLGMKQFVKKVAHTVRSLVRWLNFVLRNRYSPSSIAFLFTVLAAIVIINALFVPPYLGYANDGSLDVVMQDVMLAQRSGNRYFDYYQRKLEIVPAPQSPGTTPWLLRRVISLSVYVDHILTGDMTFDVRVLAAVYFVMYLPAIYLILRTAAAYTRSFVGAFSISALGALILSDVSLISRFASLYAYPLEIILSLYVIICVIALMQRRRPVLLHIVALGFIALLAQFNPYAGVSMAVLSVLFIVMASRSGSMEAKALSAAMAVILGLIGIVSFGHLRFAQTDGQKYNAMTRGVLSTANDPEEALAAFGIDARFATLTDTSAEQAIPYARITAPALREGFLDQYSSGRIMAYYIRHPFSALHLIDTGMRQMLNARPDYIGNYEQSAGYPARSQALMFSFWTSLKGMIVPRSIGTLVIASVIALLLLRKLRGSGGARLMAVTLTFMGCIVAQWITAVIFGGDSLMMRQACLTGAIFDMMLYFLLLGMLRLVDRLGWGGAKR
ncbi:MAG: hypothetical protein AB9880_07865 [Christensenellales bacterium]